MTCGGPSLQGASTDLIDHERRRKGGDVVHSKMLLEQGAQRDVKKGWAAVIKIGATGTPVGNTRGGGGTSELDREAGGEKKALLSFDLG